MSLVVIGKGVILTSFLLFIPYKAYKLTSNKTLLTAFNVWNDELQNPVSLVTDHQDWSKKVENYKKEMKNEDSIDPSTLKDICSKLIGSDFEFQKFKWFIKWCVKESEDKQKFEERLKNFAYW